MKHRALPRFWEDYQVLPEKVQKLADKNFKLLKSNPSHPSLHFKKIGVSKQLWSVRIGLQYRALGREKPEEIVWTWIGLHDEYEKLLKKRR